MIHDDTITNNVSCTSAFQTQKIYSMLYTQSTQPSQETGLPGLISGQDPETD